jgi:hypothetical protein
MAVAIPAPVLRGVIDRRILVNYRVDPAILEPLLPAPFRPKLIHGMSLAGICLIRLKNLRPRGVPAPIGVTSENAAHRIAVEWEENGELHEGVYIPRRDTACWPNVWVGGLVFPVVHHHARFRVKESDDDFHVELDSDDSSTHVLVDAHCASDLPSTSIFANMDEASEFFKHGSVGYSPSTRAGVLDGIELRTDEWRVEPLAVRHVESSFFDDRTLFPAGSAVFDCALLMRHIEHEWHAAECFCS